MGRQTWGTYSVSDHKAPAAFLADLMFYDRLVVPVPIPGEEAEWAKRGWAPDRQAKLVEKLAEYDRVKVAPWKVGTWELNRDSLADQLRRDAFFYTRTKLLEEVPLGIRGITPIPTYNSAADLVRDAKVEATSAPLVRNPQARVAADLALRFMAPEVSGGHTEPSDLDKILAATADREHRKARDAFWHWVSDYFGDDVITSEENLQNGVEEMAELVADLQRASRWGKVKTVGQYLFLIGSVTVAAFGGPLSPVGLGGIGLSLGKFGFDRVNEKKEALLKPTPRAALFVTSVEGLPFTSTRELLKE